MKTAACLLAGLTGVFVFVPAAAYGVATVDVEKEKAAVIAVIEEEKNAYLALDDARMAATWIQQPTSAKVYVFDGKETRFDGYTAIAAHDRENLVRERALAEAQRSRFAFADYHVTLQGDSAWATCDARWDGIWEGRPMSSTSSRIFALQRDGGRWRLALMAISGLVSEPRDQSAPACSLEGTREMVSFKFIVDGQKVASMPGTGQGRQLKTYSKDHFLFVGHFVSNGTESDSFGGGTYSLHGEEYIENREFHVAKARVGKSVHYKLVVDGDTMTMSGPLYPEEEKLIGGHLVEVYRRAD